MIQGIKRGLQALLIIGVTALLFFVFFAGREREGLEPFKSEGGWGYSVTAHGKVIIYQPFIPAVEGMIPFATRHDAMKAGRMMIEKLRDGEEPSLTIGDLNKAGIRT